MTNKQMWILIRDRNRAFYERVFKPLKLCKKGDIKKIEESLEYLFFKKRDHAGWTISFLREIDEAETDIVLHKRMPKSFIDELEDINAYVKIRGYK